MEKKKSSSEYRVELYGTIQKIIGRDLTEKEHKDFRAVIIEYVKEHGVQIALAKKKFNYKYFFECKKCARKVQAFSESQLKSMLDRKDARIELVESPPAPRKVVFDDPF